LKLKLGDSADGQAGIKGLPGIYLNDGKVPYGIPGLSGIYVGGPRQGSGLSNSKLALKTGESEAGIPQVASPATGTNQGGQSSAAPAADTSASSSPLLVNKSGLQLKTDNSDTTITAKHTTLDPSKMTPQQLADVAEMVSKLPPEEQQRLLAAAQNDAAAGHPVPSTNAQPRAKVPAPLQQQATASQAAAAAPNMEDASAKARAGFDSALPPSNSVPLSLSSNSHNSTISVPPNPIAQQTISVVDLSNKKATYTESKFFYALQASTLTPMKDGGHPIDTLESPSVGLHGLVGGTTWTFGFQWPHKKCDTKCMKDIERNLITNQLALFCSSQSDLKKCTLPFTKESYDLVVSMGSAHTAIQDLAIRVAWDGALFGEFSRQNKEIFASLKGRQFDTLDCHSNGAMLCLAALRSGDTTAKTVRLFGPQINPQAAALWRDWAHETGANIEIYINNGDPVPAISWKQPTPQTTVGKAFTAAWIVHPVVGIATIADALTYTWIDRKSAPMDNVLRDYGFKVTRLYPKRCDSIHIIDCHSMLLYEKTVGILTAEH
jgi:hypothetical protein